ncbi:TetR family transcriptional regulator [Streptomyces viridochromogenes]|uniref:TetR family transcriptional regulator n=1 Tax=Streptomyces viridochromogenes TaxID=1938 RepID=A0A0J7ZP06_STRVR|nr:TetR family transcriptional regulator [Streptomyces viridochromogenes]KMS77127.1 TetR family transcriptional regulator [Streptomyces viridochromogenes]KOG09370.1 TetR family transcriptional regulator [Streptomyces viridochromogenes]KOG27277.1 TetR family transcriptional regulator [Streptomyces viridochromogenes]
MSSSSAAPGRGEKAEAVAAKPPMREALVAAAFQLFLERGYEQTTVDDIVALAGVGRRSFFRYFPSKEDVVFPDHERCLADMTAFLGASGEEHEPVQRVCDAARLVLRMYAENPTFSVQRYRLTKQVPGLRAYELSVVWRYERALAEYLRRRFAGRRDGTLRADVIAAAVVAAHNNALRSWLRSDGQGDATAAVDHALGYAQSSFGVAPAPRSADEAADDQAEDVVVVVSRRGAPLWRVVQEIETTLGRD